MDCKEKVKQKKSAGKDENCKGWEKVQRSFGKEDFYENEVKRQQNSGKTELCEDGVKRRRNAGQGRKITRDGQPATRANASSYGRSGRQPASACEQAARERMRAGSARRENDNHNARRQRNGRERRPSDGRKQHPTR